MMIIVPGVLPYWPHLACKLLNLQVVCSPEGVPAAPVAGGGGTIPHEKAAATPF
jgi:hypothetical protein